MAAGVIIGRVAVKVIPDTSDFKESLQRDLDRIEKSLDSIEVKIDVDTDTVVKEAKKAREKAQDQMKDLRLKVNLDSEESIKRSLGQLNRELERLGEIDIDVDLNEEDLKAAMDLLNEQLDAVRTVKISIDEADPASVRSAVDKINAQLQEIKRVELSVALNETTLTEARNRLVDKMNEAYRDIRDNVQKQMKDIQIGMDVDPVKAARTLRKIEMLLEQIEDAKMTITPEMDERAKIAVMRKIQDLKNQVSDMRATIHPDLDAPRAAAISVRLAFMARDRFVDYVPRVSKSAAAAVGMALARMSGARIIGGYMNDLYRSIIQFDKAVPRIIALSLAVAGLGATGIAATSNLFALSASLASIAPAALAIPGILGGMAVGVGVLVAALKDFNKVFPDVQASLSRMQDSISDNFWGGAKKSMREMIDTLIPELTSGFDKAATRLGNFSAKLTDAVSGKLAPALGPMFDNLAKSIDIASAAADNIVGIITNLGTVGSSYLPRLAKWFVDLTTQFDKFIQRSIDNGEIFQWIDAGLVALKDLGRIGKSAALILYDIARAANEAGGSSLGILADALERIRTITSGSKFQSGLVEVFKAAHQAMENISKTAGPSLGKFFEQFGKTISAILPVVGQAIGDLVKALADALSNPAISAALIQMFTGIGIAIKTLTPVFEPLALAFATLGPLVSSLAQVLATTLAAALPPLARALMQVGAAIEPLIPIMGQALLDAVLAIAPHIPALAQAFADFVANGAIPAITTALGALLPVIQELAPLLATALVDALVAITPYVPELARAFVDLVVAVTPLIPDLLELAIALIPLIPLVIELALFLLRELVPSIQKTVKDVKDFIDIITITVKKIREWNEEFNKFCDEMVRKSKEGWTAVKKEFSTSMEAAEKNVKTWWAAIKTEFSTSMEAANKNTSTGWDAIEKEFSTSMEAAKKNTKTWWAAIKTEFSTSMEAARTNTRTGWAGINTEFSTSMDAARTNLRTWGSAIGKEFSTSMEAARVNTDRGWTNIVSAFRTGVDRAGERIRALDRTIIDATNGFGTILMSAGRSVIDGFITGIRSAFGRVRSTLSSLTSMLPDWKGPAERDATILVNSGKLVMGGFLEGLESQYDTIRKSLRGLTDDLGAGLIEAPSIAQVAQPPRQARQGLVGGMRTAVVESQSMAAGKTLIYHAAPGSSLGSEEDLFAAADRGRMVGW